MPPQIIAVGNVKGGVGKTSLAVTLAALLTKHNRSVLLVDTDKNESASQWAASIEDYPADIATDDGANLPALRTVSHDLVVVDLPGERGDALAHLVQPEAVDLLITPTRPSMLDLRPLAQWMTTVDQRVPHLAVLTMVESARPQLTENMRAQMEGKPFNWQVAPTAIRRTKAWADAPMYATLPTGMGAGNSNAYADAVNLTADVERTLNHA